jgi:hypothetical protein
MPGSDTPRLYQTAIHPSQTGWNQLIIAFDYEVVASGRCLVQIDSGPISLAKHLTRLRGSNALIGEARLRESLRSMNSRLRC